MTSLKTTIVNIFHRNALGMQSNISQNEDCEISHINQFWNLRWIIGHSSRVNFNTSWRYGNKMDTCHWIASYCYGQWTVIQKGSKYHYWWIGWRRCIKGTFERSPQRVLSVVERKVVGEYSGDSNIASWALKAIFMPCAANICLCFTVRTSFNPAL